MPGFAKVSHISFSVRDRGASADFWKRVFGLELLEEFEDQGWSATLLIHPSSGMVIEFQQHDANAGELFDPRRTGFDHMGLKVDTRAELDEWEEHFRDHGIDFTPTVDREYGSVLTFRDPDGIQYEMFYREGHP
jgi:glyoxylase I family protein